MSRAFFDERMSRMVEIDRAKSKEGGYTFVKRPKGKYHMGDFVGAVLSITDRAEMRQFYDGYVESCRTDWPSDKDYEAIARSNIGWCFGEGMPREQREAWVDVCDASHPVFGILSDSRRMVPTPDEALQTGIALGQQARRAREA